MGAPGCHAAAPLLVTGQQVLASSLVEILLGQHPSSPPHSDGRHSHPQGDAEPSVAACSGWVRLQSLPASADTGGALVLSDCPAGGGIGLRGPIWRGCSAAQGGSGCQPAAAGQGGGRLQAALCRAGSVESSRGALLLRIGSATSMWHLLKPISCPSAPCATLAAAAEAEPFQCRVCFGGGPHHSRPGHPHSAARQALHCCHAVDIWLVYDWPYGRGGRCWPCGYQEQLCATPGWR